jgi:hypothetical protein
MNWRVQSPVYIHHPADSLVTAVWSLWHTIQVNPIHLKMCLIYEGGLLSLWLYKENNKLLNWKKVFTLHIPPWAPHTYDFVVLTSLTHPRKILLVALQIGKPKTYQHPYVFYHACKIYSKSKPNNLMLISSGLWQAPCTLVCEYQYLRETYCLLGHHSRRMYISLKSGWPLRFKVISN